jgi:hypothetical protein
MITIGSKLIPQRDLLFRAWSGNPLAHTFGGKAVIDFESRPMFAELAIAETLKKEGYSTRWAETYGRGNKFPLFLTEWLDQPYGEQKDVPITERWILDILSGIASLNNGSYAGCWDVLAWKGDKLLFVESKRNKRDSVRDSQVAWLEAGLKYGLTPENFLVVQWDFE